MNNDLLETNKLYEINNINENLLEETIKETKEIYGNNIKKKLKKTIITINSKNRNIKNKIVREKIIKLKENPLSVVKANKIIVYHEDHNFKNNDEIIFKGIEGDIIDNKVQNKICNIPLKLLNYDENNGGPIFSIEIIPKIVNNEIVLDNNENYKSDQYIIKLDDDALINIDIKKNIGGNNIMVEKVIDFVQGYSNACSYIINLGKKFINIREVKLLSIEMPNSQYAIRKKKKDNLGDIVNKENFNVNNDNLYWINEDESIQVRNKILLSDKKILNLNNNIIDNLEYNKDIKKSNMKVSSMYNIQEYKYNNIIINNLLKKANDFILFLNNFKKNLKNINVYFKNEDIEEIDFSINYLFSFYININGNLLINYEIQLDDIIYNPFEHYIIDYSLTHLNKFSLIIKDFNINKGGKVEILMNRDDNSLNKIIVIESGNNYIENEIVEIELYDNNGIKRLLLIQLNKDIIKQNIRFYLDDPLEDKIKYQNSIDNIYFKLENYDISNFNYSSDKISDKKKRDEYKNYILNNLGLKNIFDKDDNSYIERTNNNESKQKTVNKFLIGYKFDKNKLINRYELKVPELLVDNLVGKCSINITDLRKVIGINTLFTNELIVNDTIRINNISRRVIRIINNLELETELWDREYINVKITKNSRKYPRRWWIEGSIDNIINEDDGNKIEFNIENDVSWEPISHEVGENDSQRNYYNIEVNNNIIKNAIIELEYNWEPHKKEIFNLNTTKKYKNYRLVIVSNFDGDLNGNINKTIYLSELRMYSHMKDINIFYTELLYNKNELCNFIEYCSRFLKENLNVTFSEIIYNTDINLILNKLENNLKTIENIIDNLSSEIYISKMKELIDNNYLNVISTRLSKLEEDLSSTNKITDDIYYNEIRINYKYINSLISKYIKDLLKIYNNYSFNGNTTEIFNKVSNINDEYYWIIKNNILYEDETKIYTDSIKKESCDTLVKGIDNEYIKYISNENISTHNIYPIHHIVINQGNYSSNKFIKEVETKMNSIEKLRYNFERHKYEELIDYDNRLTSEVTSVYHNFEIKLNNIDQVIKIRQNRKIFQYSNINKDISGEGGPIYCNENYPYLYIKHRNHNLKTGDIIDINGASSVYNINSREINLTHSIYVHDTYRCYIRLMYPIKKTLLEQLYNIGDNIDNFKKIYEDYILNNNSEKDLIEYTYYKSSNSIADYGQFKGLDGISETEEIPIFLKNELIIKINNTNLSKKYNNTIARISHINKRKKSTGNYLVDYMLLSETNFKIGDIIKTSVSGCYGIIVSEEWSENILPNLSQIGTNLELNKIINGYDGYSIKLLSSPNRTTLTGLGGINMSISIPIKISLLFNLKNTPYKELGFENKQLNFEVEHSNTYISSISNIDYVYIENDLSEDNFGDKHIIIKTQNENKFNIGDKIYIKDFQLYTELFKTTPNTILEIDTYEPFINWFDNQNIVYQKILKKNTDFNELQNLLKHCVIVYYHTPYTKIQNEYLGNIGMNIESYKNINHLDYKKNPLINIFSIKKYSYVYIYYNKKKTNVITSDGDNIITGLSDGYYKVIGNISRKYNGYLNNYDNINSVIIDISSSETYPDNYIISNFIKHKYDINETKNIMESYINFNDESDDKLHINEYYLNNSNFIKNKTPYNILDSQLNRGIIRSSINNINICGNNKDFNLSNYILQFKDIILKNVIQIKHKTLTNIPIIYKNYYKINKLILIGGKYLNNVDYKKYNNYSDYINEKNIQLNIIKNIIYSDNYYEIILEFDLENYNSDINKIDFMNNIDNIIPFHGISFLYNDAEKNTNLISVYKVYNNYSFNIDDFLNKTIIINDFNDINNITNDDYISKISHINQDNIVYYDLLNVKSNSNNDYNITIDLESYLINNFSQVYKIGNFYITELNHNNNTDKIIINNTIKYISNFIDLYQNGFITNNYLLKNLEKYVIIISNITETNLINITDTIINTYDKIPYKILTDDISKFNKNITNNDLINYNTSNIILNCSANKTDGVFIINKSYPINDNDIVTFKNYTYFGNILVANKKFIIKQLVKTNSQTTFKLYYNDNHNKILDISNIDVNEEYNIELTTNIYKYVKSSWRPLNFDYLIEYIFDLIIKSLSLSNITLLNLNKNSIIGHYLTDDIENNRFNISIQQENETYLWDTYILDYLLHIWLLTLSNKELTENQKQIKTIMNKSFIQFNFNINYSYILYANLTKNNIYSEIKLSNNIITYNTGSATIIYDLYDNLLVNYIIFTQITDIKYYNNNIGSFILFGKKAEYDYKSKYNWELIQDYDNLLSSNSNILLVNYINGQAVFNFKNDTTYRYYKFILKSFGLIQYNFTELFIKHIQFKYLNLNNETTYSINNIYTNFNSIFKYVPSHILDNIIQNETSSLVFNSESGIITFELQNEDIITTYKFIIFNNNNISNTLYYIKQIILYGSNNSNLNDLNLINNKHFNNFDNEISNTFINTKKYKYYKIKIISQFLYDNNDYKNTLLINDIDKIYISSILFGNIKRYDYNKLYIQDNNYIINVIDKDLYYNLELKYNLINTHLKGENIIIMDNIIENNMFNTQNLIMNGKWYTRIFYQGNDSIYNFSDSKNTIYENKYKILSTNITSNNKIIYNLTVSDNKYFLNGYKQNNIYFNIGDTIIFNINDTTIDIHDIKFSTVKDGRHNGFNTITSETNINVLSSNDGDKYTFNNYTQYFQKYNISIGTYTFIGIPEQYPLAILLNRQQIDNEIIKYSGDNDKLTSKTINGIIYDFYYGDISVIVLKEFTQISIYSLNNGYMGGENILQYSEYNTISFNEYEYISSITKTSNSIILSTNNTMPSKLYYYSNIYSNMGGEIINLNNINMSQIYYENGLIYQTYNIYINEHNNILYIGYTYNDEIIYKEIKIPSNLNKDKNGITSYTPEDFSIILQQYIRQSYHTDSINCDIEITFNKKNQLFQFYSPSHSIFNLYFSNDNNYINNNILRTIGFNNSQLNYYLYYTNTNFIIYRNSKITFDVSSNNLINNNINIYQYINNTYINCSENILFYKYGIKKYINNKIVTFYFNNNGLINYENDYDYNLIWSLGQIDKNNINNNNTGNIIIKQSHKKEGYPYFQEYLPNQIYISNMKGVYIPNTNIYINTDNEIKTNHTNKTYIYPLQDKHYTTAEFTNLNYVFNHEKYIFNIDDTFNKKFNTTDHKDDLYINNGTPILGYFKNNYYLQYNNNKWCIYYLGDDTIIKEFNFKQDAFNYIETLQHDWIDYNYQEKFYVNYYSILIEGKFRGIGGTISNRWKSESNILNDYYYGFTIKDKILDINNQYTKLKTIIRLRDLGINSPKQVIGDIDYLNNIKDYIIGYDGYIYEKTLNNPVDISGNKYIYFSIKNFNKILDINNNISAFAKIILPSAPGKDMYNNFISTETIFDDKPLDELTQLQVDFFDEDGFLFDFNSLNHSFTLEITEEIDYIENTNILSKTIFQQ
jgi:hypothetical protein